MVSKGASVAGVADPGPASAVSDRGYNFACPRFATIGSGTPRKTNSPAVPISSGLCGDELQSSRGKIREFKRGRGGGSSCDFCDFLDPP